MAHAYEARLLKGQLPATLDAMLTKASTDTQVAFDKDDFLLVEDRNLATSNFKMYAQTNSYVPVSQTAVRIWSDLETGEMILGEMHLSEKTQQNADLLRAKFQKAKFS